MKHVLLLDMAIHTFDAARYLAGADALTVYCKEWNPKGSWYDHDASAVAIFEMSNGIVFTYRGSWCARGLGKEFLECIRTGRTPETVCTDNIQSLAMVFGAIESAETGKRVEIEI